ncbi:MAG: type II secretory pathway, component PulD [Pseudomonadota bacterium]
MKSVLVGFIAVIALCLPARSQDSGFNLQRIPVREICQLFFGEVLKTPYVLEPSILADERVISARFSAGTDPLTSITAFLRSLGISVTRKNGVDYVAIRDASQIAQDDLENFVYQPIYRDVSFLVELLQPLFVKGSFTSTRAIQTPGQAQGTQGKDAAATVAPQGSAAALVGNPTDIMLFTGPEKEVAALKKLLPQVDKKLGEVLVRVQVYEVSNSDRTGSGFSLALGLLGGHMQLALGAPGQTGDAVARFKNNVIDVAYNILDADSRFKVVSSPSLRVKSGTSGRFSVGQEVPVLGAVSYPGNGAPPVQSVDYRASGVIFELQPIVRNGSIDLTVNQQISSFVATSTGVNNSPTLIKREVQTALNVSDGEIVVLGGLAETKESKSDSGPAWLPQFLHNHAQETARTEIILVLQVTSI